MCFLVYRIDQYVVTHGDRVERLGMRQFVEDSFGSMEPPLAMEHCLAFRCLEEKLDLAEPREEKQVDVNGPLSCGE